MIRRRAFILLLSLLLFVCSSAFTQVKIDTLGPGWAKTSINTVIFRKNSLATHQKIQYAAYYDGNGFVVIAKRSPGSPWASVRTALKGNVSDAHNSISIAVDGDGYLHMAWDHHNTALRYCRSKSPGSLELTGVLPMTGKNEGKITYPEFHRLPSGDLLFLYRHGESGEGNLIVNLYNVRTKTWKQVNDNLIDGEGARNAYWQACVDEKGSIHLSWVWRETWDVSTNHDLCYARSDDGGVTWKKTSGEKYVLPINAGNSEYALRIPQNSGLINQTSMSADKRGNPYIASYWKKANAVPQYFVVWNDGSHWRELQVSNRKQDFSLAGGGTKKIPVSRPQIIVDDTKVLPEVRVIYRDQERGSKISIAHVDLKKGIASTSDVAEFAVGDWEPTYDIDRWKQDHKLNIFVQRTGQGDGEKEEDIQPQPVVVIEL